MNGIPRELEEAARFHTHLGPFLVVGLRMGRAVVRRLGEKPFSYRVRAHTGRVPPYSCTVDGIQLATPCTTGNGCLEVTEDRLMAVDAIGETEALRVALKKEIFDSIENDCTEDDQEMFAMKLWEMSDEELFIVTSEDVASTDRHPDRLTSRSTSSDEGEQ
jgi:formylmethanofuran dehydrogenase subunit E